MTFRYDTLRSCSMSYAGWVGAAPLLAALVFPPALRVGLQRPLRGLGLRSPTACRELRELGRCCAPPCRPCLPARTSCRAPAAPAGPWATFPHCVSGTARAGSVLRPSLPLLPSRPHFVSGSSAPLGGCSGGPSTAFGVRPTGFPLMFPLFISLAQNKQRKHQSVASDGTAIRLVVRSARRPGALPPIELSPPHFASLRHRGGATRRLPPAGRGLHRGLCPPASFLPARRCATRRGQKLTGSPQPGPGPAWAIPPLGRLSIAAK